jgi:ABC-type lipoprotein release transport system permease subunit
LILGQAFRITALGLGMGLPCAWVATRFIRGAIAGIDAPDSVTFVSAACLVAVIPVAAAWLPARRAAAIDPMDALRSE